MTQANRYTRLLEKWLKASAKYMFHPHGDEELSCYGSGTADAWAMQAHCAGFAAYAVLAAAEEFHPGIAGLSQDEALHKALGMFRYAARSCQGGDITCVDGRQWMRDLAVQRMAHGVRALQPYFNAADKELLSHMLTAHCDALLGSEIRASIEKNNCPESNGWHGCVLLQTLLFFPDHPRSGEYREKATAYFLNGVSIPADADSNALINGKPLSKWHVGANFRDTMSLCHHGYLNIGYMMICLSNAAMAHFACREAGVPAPEEIYHHIGELWQLVKKCTFPDGRLMRIGGDTRARYCYCQDYALPSWLMLFDQYGDSDCLRYEERWLETVAMEQEHNGDGSFLSERLSAVARHSPFYYTRLEGDRAVALSMGACWRKLIGEKSGAGPAPHSESAAIWIDREIGGVVCVGRNRSTSWSWKRLPCGLILPAGQSAMAEWHCNLFGEIRGMGVMERYEGINHYLELVPGGGFVSCGATKQVTEKLWGEGEADAAILIRKNAFFALPDDCSAIVMQYAGPLTATFVCSIKGLFLNMPNDIFNHNRRVYASQAGRVVLTGCPRLDEVVPIDSPWLVIDGILGLADVYGGNGFFINRPAQRQVEIRGRPPLTSLYVDEICMVCESGPIRLEYGKPALDLGAVIWVGADAENICGNRARRVECPAAHQLRAIMTRDAAGKAWVAIANFGEASVEFKASKLGGRCLRDPITGDEFIDKDGQFSLPVAGYGARLLAIET